jgi:tRNA wybutosine-synthesizing protein 2
MSFKSQLQEKLIKKLDKKEIELLPSGYQALGEICVINLNEKLLSKKKEIGKEILILLPRFKVIYNKKGEISGKFREPQLEFLFGDKNIKEAKVIENNCAYSFDVTKLMFAKGNINERIRIAKQVKKNEIIIDMFAGIGYFSVPIGKLSFAKKIYSIELNPNAFEYLNKNIKLNNISNVETINGDCIKEITKLKEKGVIADRIVMGYLPPPIEFVDSALMIIKKKGVIHYETLLNEDKLEEEIEKVIKEINEKAKAQNKKVKLLKNNYVKGYKPHINHYVLDLIVE